MASPDDREPADELLATYCPLDLFCLVGQWAKKKYGNRLLTQDDYNALVAHLGRVEQIYAAAEKPSEDRP